MRSAIAERVFQLILFAFPITALLTVMACPLAAANPYPLMVGDQAPKLLISKWIKGDPIADFAQGTTYVVEFWATWCPPCNESIPHLTEVQKKFGEKATVIGVNIWEPNQADVPPFVQAKAEKMDYHVGLDTYDDPKGGEGAKDGKWAHDHGLMSKTWMAASGWDQIGIPTAFIINQQGKVAWIGDPMVLEKPLAGIVDGKWNLDEHAKTYLAEQEVVKENRAMVKAMEEAREKGNVAEAVALADKYLARDPVKNLDILGFKFECLYVDQKNIEAANACARQALENGKNDDANPLPTIGYVMAFVTPNGINPDADLGLKIATKCDEMAEGKSAGMKQVLAKFLFLKGDYPRAVEVQTKAIEISLSKNKTEMMKRLEEYKKAAGETTSK